MVDQPSPKPNLPIQLFVVGSEMVSFTIAGLLIDYALGSMPWATVILTVLGMVAAFLHLVRMVNLKGRPPGPRT